jgi:hypothetical protein
MRAEHTKRIQQKARKVNMPEGLYFWSQVADVLAIEAGAPYCLMLLQYLGITDEAIETADCSSMLTREAQRAGYLRILPKPAEPIVTHVPRRCHIHRSARATFGTGRTAG